MTESLSIKGVEVASDAPAKAQPWVASFHPGVMDMNSDDLKVRATVTFPNPAMYDAFRLTESLAGDTSWKFSKTGTTATRDF